jgi:hypothetical protein
VSVIQAYLEDPRFAGPEVPDSPDPDLNPNINGSKGTKGGALLRENRNYFEQAGYDVATNINKNEPANIATWIVKNDKPYWEVLNGNYTVNDDFIQLTPQDTFDDQVTNDANAAGILTTRAWIYYNKSAYNFHIVNMAFQKFLCSDYPDAEDPGMTKAFVSDKRKSFTSNSNGGMDCFFCHHSINPKAYLFYNYYKDNINDNQLTGKYVAGGLDPAANIITTRTDMANDPRSIPEDILCNKQADTLTKPPATPNPNGMCKTDGSGRVVRERVAVTIEGKPAETVKDLGKIMSVDQRFAKCVVQHHVNWMFGLGYKSKLTEDMSYMVDVFRGTPDNKPYNVKRLLLEIAKSAQFVNR